MALSMLLKKLVLLLLFDPAGDVMCERLSMVRSDSEGRALLGIGVAGASSTGDASGPTA
jgi:hypothetical protein